MKRRRSAGGYARLQGDGRGLSLRVGERSLSPLPPSALQPWHLTRIKMSLDNPLAESLKQRALIASLLLLYAALIHWGYVTLVAEYFAYLGYYLYPRSVQELVWAYLFAWLPAIFVPLRVRRPSHLVVWYLSAFVYLPTLVVGALATDLKLAALLDLYLKLIVGLFLLSLPGWFAPPATVGARIPKLIILGGLTIFLFAAVGYMAARLGVRTPVSPFSLVEIYTARLEAREWGTVINYLMRLLGNVIGPFLIAWGLIHRRWLIIVAGCGVQLFIFSYDGTKSTLLLTFLVFLTWYITTRARGYGFFLGLLLLLYALILPIDYYRESVEISSIVFRRLTVTPGLLTAYYYDFFQENPPFLWSHSFLRWAVDNPYGMAPAYVIGLNYFGDIETSANANLWADGIANVGSWGILLISAAAAVFLWFVDGVSRRNEVLAVMTLAAPASALINSAFTTSLITHGLLAAVCLIWLFGRRQNFP